MPHVFVQIPQAVVDRIVDLNRQIWWRGVDRSVIAGALGDRGWAVHRGTHLACGGVGNRQNRHVDRSGAVICVLTFDVVSIRHRTGTVRTTVTGIPVVGERVRTPGWVWEVAGS